MKIVGLVLVVVIALCVSPVYSQLPHQGAEQQSKDPATETNRAYSDAQPQDASPKPAPSAIKDIPPEHLRPTQDNNTNRAQQQEPQGINWDKAATIINAISTTVVACLTIALAIFAGWQVKRSRQTIEVMRESIEAQKSQLEQMRLEHRPWVDVDISITRPLTLDQNGAHLHLRITVKNGGHASAIRCVPMVDLLINPDPSEAVATRERHRLPDLRLLGLMPLPPSEPNGSLLLPGATKSFPWPMSVERRDFGGQATIIAQIIGEIAYADSRDGHGTPFHFMYQPASPITASSLGEFPGVLIPVPDIGGRGPT